MGKRSDIHRPGAIIPAHYEYVLSYNHASGQETPAWGINCEVDHAKFEKGKWVAKGEHAPGGMCCLIGLRTIAKVKFVETGGSAQCSVCSTHFVYGDVWRHEPTGEYLFIGQICARKYELMADRSEYEMAAGRAKAARAIEIAREANAQERAEFLAAHPGLEAALGCEHHIVKDIAQKFKEYRSLSDKQIALVFKLAEEARNPRPEEKYVPAPAGRATFRGKVVSVKNVESDWGVATKMTVKVETPEGSWLAWGTAPAGLLSEASGHDGSGLKGAEVEITATLKAGRDAHFALMGRPSGKVVSLSCPADCRRCEEEAPIKGLVAFISGLVAKPKRTKKAA